MTSYTNNTNPQYRRAIVQDVAHSVFEFDDAIQAYMENAEIVDPSINENTDAGYTARVDAILTVWTAYATANKPKVSAPAVPVRSVPAPAHKPEPQRLETVLANAA
jgi:hypothetical protein